MASVSHQGSDQPGAFPASRDDRCRRFGPFGALVAGRPRTRASGPLACELILLADAGFIW